MGPGLWVTPEELNGSFAADPGALEACVMASTIMWALSGRKYTRTRTVTETYSCPKRRPLYRMSELGFARPVLDGAAVANVLTQDSCACGSSGDGKTRLRLRGTPVRTIHGLRVGSAPVQPSRYRVTNSGVLEVDQAGPGGACGLEVTYTYGTGLPAGGRVAARLLATEFMKSWTGSDDCRLPDRVTNVSREGISFTVMDKQDFLDDLRTGIYEVDLFLRSVNPDRARKRARVFSPDLPKASRVTAGPGYLPPSAYLTSTRYGLFVEQGAALIREFSRTVDGAPANLSGYSWRAQIRAAEDPDSALILDLTTYLTIDADDPSTLVLYVPASVTADLEPFPDTASWDMFIWPASDPDAAELWVQGPAGLDPSASAPPA